MDYQKTHPWIRFSPQLPIRARYSPLWFLLGQVCSKILHLSSSPASPEVHFRLNYVYLLKGVQATTAIEGNTLTEAEINQIAEGKAKIAKSKQYQEQEVKNVLEACNRLVDDVCRHHIALTPEYICQLNATVLKNLETKDGIIPGQVRDFSVVIGNVYRGAPAHECDALLAMLCEWLSSDAFAAPEGMEQSVAIIKAIIAHIYLAWIHPFGDGNGRTARLVELFILLDAGVPVPAAHLLSNHYNKTRDAYYRRLAELSRLKDGGYPDFDEFLVYAIQGLADGLQEQLDLIQEYQLNVTWVSLVYSHFQKVSKTALGKRRRDLLLSLPNGVTKITRFGDISQTVFYEHYKDKTLRTLYRDLDELVKANLLLETPDGYLANRDMVKKMLPIRSREA